METMNPNSYFEKKEKEKNEALKEIERMLVSLGASKDEIKNILDRIRNLSDFDWGKFLSGDLEKQLKDILYSIRIEKGRMEEEPGKFEKAP